MVVAAMWLWKRGTKPKTPSPRSRHISTQRANPYGDRERQYSTSTMATQWTMVVTRHLQWVLCRPIPGPTTEHRRARAAR
jgi:hypothetical protein